VTRFIVVALVAVAVFGVACSESTTGVPSSRIGATGSASADEGLPPPPPLTGGGSGELSPEGDASVNVASTSSSALTTCSLPGSVSLTYAFDFLLNKTDNNSFAHLNLDGQAQNVTIHQNGSTIDAHGLIVGDGFTFLITDVTSGELSASGFSLDLIGTVTFADGSKCQAAARLDGSLVGDIGD
jgi:hypothetical protein